MIRQLRDIFHRNEIRFHAFYQTAKCQDQRPLRFVFAISSAPAIRGERLAWRATCQESVLCVFVIGSNLLGRQLRDISLDKWGTIIGLKRIFATWVNVKSGSNVNTTTD